MNSSLNRVPENGSEPIESVNVVFAVQRQKHSLNAFDLVKVGLSSTFAIAVFFGIGYVVKHVAGPSTILSVLLAAFIAYLVGAFYAELNTAIVLSANKSPETLSQVLVTSPSETTNHRTHSNGSGNFNTQSKSTISSDFLLGSYQLTHIIFNSEFAAFVIAWNLIMEYIVIVALISKALVIFIDALFFRSVSHLHQIIPMVWYFSQYFDVIALLVPIVIGVPLLLILCRDTILNAVSIVLSLLTVLLVLFISISNANTSNWDRVKSANGDVETGGFYAFGADGVFRGVIIILFVFIAFDLMLMSRSHDSVWFSKRNPTQTGTNIQHFGGTITSSILSINTAIFVCLLGMAFALTTNVPVHLMDENIPMLTMVDVIFEENEGVRMAISFIILIAGSIALVGSLYAMLHSQQRILQTMLSTDADDSTFKLFGKFGLSHLQQEIRLLFDEPNVPANRSNDTIISTPATNATTSHSTRAERHRKQQQQLRHSQWQMYACLLFSILSGLLAGLFDVEHLINLLSIGTMLMLFALTINVMILRHSAEVKQRLHSSHANGISSSNHLKSTRSISLLTILLTIYCCFAVTLTIFVRLVTSDTITVSTTIFWIFNSILIVGLLVIVVLLSAQPKGNAIFSFNLSHPLFPALVLFGCIYLCSAIDVAAWIRLAVWMVIGLILYICTLANEKQPKQVTSSGIMNDGFVADVQSVESVSPDNAMVSETTLKLEECSVSFVKNVENLEENLKNDSSNSIHSINQPPNVVKEEPNDSNRETVAIELEQIVKSPAEQTSNTSEETDTPLEIVAVAEQKPHSKNYLDKSKLDEITSVDDVKDTCIERREPNGTAYFVEVDKFQNESPETNESPSQNAHINQTNQINGLNDASYFLNYDLERNIVERVVNQNDVEFQPESKPIANQEPISPSIVDSDSEKEEEELEVRAIVHAPNGHSSTFHTPPTTPVIIQPIDSSENDAQTLKSPNFQIGVYEAIPKQKLLFETDKSRLAFKTRLENLFGQNDGTVTLGRRIHKKSPLNSPKAIQSKRMSFDTRLNHSISAPESLHIPIDGTTSKDSFTSINILTPCEIPQAPVFNQELYDTIGRRKRKEFSSTSNVIDINSSVSNGSSYKTPEPIRKGNLSRTKAHENLTVLDNIDKDGNDDDDDDASDHNVPSSANIRQRLEHIFSRGQTTQVTNVAELDINQNENIRHSKRREPFDTVRMQKMRFSTVLQSIGPDIHTNLHPTQTTAAIDILEQQRRDSLNLNEHANNNPLKTL